MTRTLAGAGLALLLLGASTPAHAAVTFSASNVPLVFNPTAVTTADFDEDGRLDFVAGGSSTNLVLGLDDGAGAFALTTVVAGLSSTYGLVAGDFDGDGNVDVAVSGGSNTLRVYRGNGHGGLAFHSSVSQSGAYDLATFDADGDGDLDIVVNTMSELELRTGDGTGSFVSGSPSMVPPGAFLTSLVVADLNGDGHADLAASDPLQNTLELLHGDGAGAFVPTSVAGGGVYPSGLAAADFDQDGSVDLAMASVVHGTGVAFGSAFVAPTTFAGASEDKVAAADFDLDGTQDTVTTATTAGTATVLTGDGAGGFGTPVGVALGGYPRRPVVADVGDDGFPDVLVANSAGARIEVLRNTSRPAVTVTGAPELGEALPGETGTRRAFSVSNTGNAALHVGAVALTGDDFRIAGDTCSQTRVQIGGTCVVDVEFAPLEGGVRGATLSIPGQGASASIALTGTGTVVPEPPVATPEPPVAPEEPQPVVPVDPAPANDAAPPSPCVSRRTVTLTLPRHLRGASVTVTRDGRRIARYARAGRKVTLRLAGQPKGTIRVTLKGRRGKITRTFRTCTPKKVRASPAARVRPDRA